MKILSDSLSESERKEIDKTAKHLLAGALARASAAIIMFPVDVIKARLQFQGRLITNVKTYKGPVDAFKTILREEGFSALFRGLPPRLLYITPSAAVSFAIYEQFKTIFLDWRKNTNSNSLTSTSIMNSQNTPISNNNNSGSQSPVNPAEVYAENTANTAVEGSVVTSDVGRVWFHPLVPLMAGAIARLVGTATRTPFDMVKYRLQVQGFLEKKMYTGTLDAFTKIIKTEGVLSLWTGYAISLMRDVPFASIYFLSYEYGKILQNLLISKAIDHYYDYDDIENETKKLNWTASNLLAGAAAGGIAATCTIPFDAVKTRLQTQATLPIEHQRYKGVFNTFKLTYKEEGFRGFTKGLYPRLIYLMPSASLTFAFYEQYKKYLFST